MEKNENLYEDQVEHKELAPGVILYKEYKQKNEGNIVGLFIWKVEITTMSIVDFEVHLDQSENIELENCTNVNELKTVNKIHPFETKEVAKVILKQGWKLKSKFKLTMNVPDKEMQYQYIEQDEALINEQEKVFRQFYENLPLEIMSKDEIEKELAAQKISFIDLDFIPNDDAIVNPRYGENMKDLFDYVIHWRRPHDFCLVDVEEENKEIQIFNYQDVEPNDIQQGILPDNHLASALSALAEKGNLIKRLFKSDKYSAFGVYQVKLCIAGEWNTITIDDYFPCIPKSNPLVSRSPGNEIWVLILEKAIAKVFESYYSLIQVNLADFFLLLTGCPTFHLNLDELVKTDGHEICLKRLKTFVSEKKYLVVALSKPNESELGNDEAEDDMLTIGNYGYTVLDIKNNHSDYLVTLRKIWFDQKKEENIRLYEEELKKNFPMLETNEGQLTLSK